MVRKPNLLRILLALIIELLALGSDKAGVAVGQRLPPTEPQASSSGRKVIILLDTNPHQKKVISVELAVAEGIIRKLNRTGNVFSIIAFGSKNPALLKIDDTADNAMSALRNVTLEETKEKYLSVRFYDALKLALDQFADDARMKSIIIISEGNDSFPNKMFKETVRQMQQGQIVCHAAMVASHSFYGTKGIQFYGFDLRRLVGKTHGQYVEVEGNQKKVPRSVDQISEAIAVGRGR